MGLRAGSFSIVPGAFYGSPKEVWGFRSQPRKGRPTTIAREFLSANVALLKLEGVAHRLKLRHVVESVGAWHVIFEQRHLRRRIHRAYVTVHVGRDRRVFLVKNRAVPKELLPKPIPLKLDEAAARRRAVKTLRKRASGISLSGLERLWFPKGEELRPAYKFRLHRRNPRQEWLIYVDAVTGGILSRYNNLAFAQGAARVFDPNPVVALGDWHLLLSRGNPVAPPDSAYVSVTLQGLGTSGFLTGGRVTTSPTPQRVRSTTHRFILAARQRGFEEVMAYFHIDRAIRYLEALGYSGRRKVFRKPVKVNARGTREDNSWYSPGERSLTFGTGASTTPKTPRRSSMSSATRCRMRSVPILASRRKPRRWARASGTTSPAVSSRPGRRHTSGQR